MSNPTTRTTIGAPRPGWAQITTSIDAKLGWMTDWRPGWALPVRFTTTIDGELPYLVELDLSAPAPGECNCLAVRYSARDGGEPVTARGVREVQLGDCIRHAIRHVLTPVVPKPGEIVIPLGSWRDYDALATLGPQRRVSEDHLRRVAAIYSAATSRPTQAVQNEFGPISHSTAARWVGLARRAGFLPPAARKHPKGDKA